VEVMRILSFITFIIMVLTKFQISVQLSSRRPRHKRTLIPFVQGSFNLFNFLSHALKVIGSARNIPEFIRKVAGSIFDPDTKQPETYFSWYSSVSLEN
jgi:hypothetical protein